MSNPETVIDDVAKYYSEKLAEYGHTPRGVDWNGEDSQVERFRQLTRVLHDDLPFSINDLGCGYGAFFNYLVGRFSVSQYTGIDISRDMIQAAQGRHSADKRARFVVSAEPDQTADYGIASGIFNVRLGHGDKEWQDHLEDTLNSLDRTSQLGFAFNCLTAYSDENKKRPYLYYPDPCAIFDLCKRRYSKRVALLHDYDLYEFTILVRK